MSHLIPCTDCERHVRASDADCPFCGAPLPDAAPPPRAALPRRAGRAATFAFGAALFAASSGCGESHTPDGDAGELADAGRPIDAGVDSGAIVAAYGAPAIDAGPEEDAGFFPPYGTPPQEGDHALI